MSRSLRDPLGRKKLTYAPSPNISDLRQKYILAPNRYTEQPSKQFRSKNQKLLVSGHRREKGTISTTTAINGSDEFIKRKRDPYTFGLLRNDNERILHGLNPLQPIKNPPAPKFRTINPDLPTLRNLLKQTFEDGVPSSGKLTPRDLSAQNHRALMLQYYNDESKAIEDLRGVGAVGQANARHANLQTTLLQTDPMMALYLQNYEAQNRAVPVTPAAAAAAAAAPEEKKDPDIVPGAIPETEEERRAREIATLEESKDAFTEEAKNRVEDLSVVFSDPKVIESIIDAREILKIHFEADLNDRDPESAKKAVFQVMDSMEQSIINATEDIEILKSAKENSPEHYNVYMENIGNAFNTEMEIWGRRIVNSLNSTYDTTNKIENSFKAIYTNTMEYIDRGTYAKRRNLKGLEPLDDNKESLAKDEKPFDLEGYIEEHPTTYDTINKLRNGDADIILKNVLGMSSKTPNLDNRDKWSAVVASLLVKHDVVSKKLNKPDFEAGLAKLTDKIIADVRGKPSKTKIVSPFKSATGIQLDKKTLDISIKPPGRPKSKSESDTDTNIVF